MENNKEKMSNGERYSILNFLPFYSNIQQYYLYRNGGKKEKN